MALETYQFILYYMVLYELAVSVKPQITPDSKNNALLSVPSKCPKYPPVNGGDAVSSVPGLWISSQSCLGP